MKWRITPKPVPDYLDWHTKFAWTPVQIGDYKHWLCWVSRRADWTDPIPDRATVNQIIHKCGCNKWKYAEPVYYG